METKVSPIFLIGSANSTPLYVSPSASRTNSRKDIASPVCSDLVVGFGESLITSKFCVTAEVSGTVDSTQNAFHL